MPEVKNCSDLKQANMQWSSFIFHEEVWGNLDLNSPMLMWQLDFAKYMDTRTFPSVHEWIIILYFFFSPLCLHSKLQEGTTHEKGGQGVHNCCLLRNVLKKFPVTLAQLYFTGPSLVTYLQETWTMWFLSGGLRAQLIIQSPDTMNCCWTIAPNIQKALNKC